MDVAFVRLAASACEGLRGAAAPAAAAVPPGPDRSLTAFVLGPLLVLIIGLTPLGVSKAFADNGGPCVPIPYTVDPSAAPAGGVETARAAFELLSAATGIAFVDDGPAAARVVVIWVEPDNGRLLGGDPSRSGWTVARWDGLSMSLVAGVVHLNAGTTLPSGFDDRRSWGGVLMHEVGHLVGLGHANARSEMMYPDVITGPARWGPSDLAQLRAAGARLGCGTTAP